jgi:hypothetical protein
MVVTLMNLIFKLLKRFVRWESVPPSSLQNWSQQKRIEWWLNSPYHTWISNCLMSRFIVMMLLFMHLSTTFITLRFSNCSPTMDVRFVKLTVGTFCGNQDSRIFRSAVTYAASAVWFFKTILLDVWQSPLPRYCLPMIRVCQHDLRNCSWYIQLPQMFQLNAHQRSVLFQNQTSLPVSDALTQTVNSTQSLIIWYEHYKV